MAYAIYYLKIQLFSNRFEMSNEVLRGVKRMADFIAIYYTKAFLESRLASKTPAGDLKFLHQMNLYRTQDASAAAICVKSILNHLWYLTEELVVFAIFDTDLPATVRKAMVLKLLSIHRPKTFAPKNRSSFHWFPWSTYNFCRQAQLVAVSSPWLQRRDIRLDVRPRWLLGEHVRLY